MASRRQISPIPEYHRLRTRRACYICRRRKVKCDGVTPSCGQCSLRGAMCYYKDDETKSSSVTEASSLSHATVPLYPSITGNAKTSAENSPNSSARRGRPVKRQKAEFSPVTFSDSPTQGSEASPIHSTVYSGVTATNPGVESFIYYGPASTFSFIQHIHQEINSGIIEMNSVGDVPEGIKRFGFRDLFLGWNAGGLTAQNNQEGNMKFLDPIKAKKFIDNFWNTLVYIMPVYSREYLESVLDSMYCTEAQTSNGEAGLLAVLATGASLEGENEWSSILFQRSYGIVNQSNEIVSTDRVKVLLLLSHHQAMTGKLNTAYMLSGQSVRLAYACGLHREFPSLSQYSDGAIQGNRDRRITLWSLYSFERLLSISLGRPSAFNDNDLDVAVPDNDFLRYMAPLGRISMKSSNQIYGLDTTSLLSIWEAATAIDEELKQYQSELPPSLRFEDFGKPGIYLHVDAFAIGCHFYMFKTLTYRPFLLMDAMCRQQERVRTAQGQPTLPQVEEQYAFLPEACRRAVEAGRGLLLLLARSYSSNPMLATMRFNSMFLQNACAILLFDILRDPSNKQEVDINFEITNIALECYRLMNHDVGVESGLRMIEQVLERARAAVEAAGAASAIGAIGAVTSTEVKDEGPIAESDIMNNALIESMSVFSPLNQWNESSAIKVPYTSSTGDPAKTIPTANAGSVESTNSNELLDSPEDALNKLSEWEKWEAGIDWIKSGFMLPNSNDSFNDN
ncbi:hypothetical protein V1514DRAFT_365301 [Lipomyces japonicus]|uniref:uncharacterized protein n=1 Tax=Lipomyces japonicus TaxID=56871 RepID=UPI0034CF9CD6